MSEPADLPDFRRRRRASPLLWLAGFGLASAGLFAAAVWLGFQNPGYHGVEPIPTNLHQPDDAIVTVEADSPAVVPLLEKGLSAYNGGHYLYLKFGPNHLPPGRYRFEVLNVPDEVVFDPPIVRLEKKQTATVRVRLVKQVKE